MKKLINLFLLIFCLTFATCKSQNDKDISSYYKMIDQAENHILLEEYLISSEIYESSFKVHTNMFATDLYNALLCNIYLKNWKACGIWSSRLIRKGIKKDFFNSNLFADFKKSKEWSNVNKKFAEYEENLNTVYKKQLDSLLVEDQKVYCSIPSGDISYEDAKVNTVTIEQKFSNLIYKYGFPTEEKVGIHIYNDTLISFVPTFYALIRHGYQSGNSQLIAHFNKALISGEMDRKLAVTNAQDQNKYVLYGGSMYKKKSKDMTKEDVFCERKLNFIDKNEGKGFVIYADFVNYSNFVDETSVEIFHKMYDIFIPNWQGPN